MERMTIVIDGWVCRWSGGSFIAAWHAERADDVVPDEMIELPASLTRTHATRDDITRIAREALTGGSHA